jgi:hypothetical protein
VIHTLKTWPGPFAAVLDGTKTHEIRVVDRPYAVGDVLHLQEWQRGPHCYRCTHCDMDMASYADFEEYQHGGCGGTVEVIPERAFTGRSIRVEVTHLTPGGSWGLPANLCVMSIRRIEWPLILLHNLAMAGALCAARINGIRFADGYQQWRPGCGRRHPAHDELDTEEQL